MLCWLGLLIFASLPGLHHVCYLIKGSKKTHEHEDAGIRFLCLVTIATKTNSKSKNSRQTDSRFSILEITIKLVYAFKRNTNPLYPPPPGFSPFEQGERRCIYDFSV